MDRKQKRRLLIFSVVPLLALLLFITDDIVFRVIIIALIIIYVAFIIFLRDSLKFRDTYGSEYEREDSNEEDLFEPPPGENFEESFKVVSNNKETDIITSENYKPDKLTPKTTLKPSDLKEKFEEIANEKFPSEMGNDGQFSFVLEKMLTVVKEAYMAHTAVFFWYNKQKDKLTIEKYISNSTEITKKKLEIEDDILSKIVHKGEPELLTDISPAAEADVIRYYNSPQGIKSFVGVPLFYDKSLIAIIAIDSKLGDNFGIETIYALGRFVRVITMIIGIFEEKHSDSVSQQRLAGVLNLVTSGNRFESEEELVNSIQNSVTYLIPWDAFAFVYYKPLEQKFKIVKSINKTSLKYVGHNLEIELNNTLVGKSISTGVPIKIDDTSASKYIHYSKMEDVSFEGSFLSIPLIYNKQNYGAFCFESLKKNAFANTDVHFLKDSALLFTYVIYSFSTQTLLRSYISIDIETKALNAKNFKERLLSDAAKAEKLNVPGAIALIRIDDFLEQDSLFDGNPFPVVLQTVAETIWHELSPLNLFGRLEDKVFAVYFFNSTAKDAFVWSERLRVKIARKPIAVVSKQTTFTISVGVASASEKSDVDEIINNANLALQKAIERGGNAVRNIN
jgi:diguanylate cyclase (GGDEF)-like protein